MKTKIHLFVAFLLLGMNVIQAQIRGQVQFNSNSEAIKIIKDNGFDRIITDAADIFIEDPGSPALPILLKSYLIPVDADNVTLNIQNISKQKIEGQYTVYPAQPPVPVGSNESRFIDPNAKIYDSKNPYPDKKAEIISDNFYMGYRILTIRLYPVEYIPQTKELYLCNLNFSIDYSMPVEGGANSNQFVTQTQSLYRYEMNKKAVKFQVENPEAVDNYDTKVQRVKQGKTVIYDFSASSNEKGGTLRSQSVSVFDEQMPDYIIITCDSLKSAFQPLADWKTKKGVFTIIETTEDINANFSGSDLQEKIRNYLIDAKRKWGYCLYVLLGGDINIIPARLVQGTNDLLSYPSDRYYYTSDTWTINKGNVFNNYFPSLSIINILGRIPVSNAKEVAVYTNKVIGYEKASGLGDLSYLKNNLYADAYLGIDTLGCLLGFCISNIKQYANEYVPSYINNKYICDNANCTGDSLKYLSQINPHICPGGDVEQNRDNFLSCLNTGLGIGKFHFIYHMDHGNPFSISTSSYDKGQNISREDMDNLSNGPSWQIFMSGACHSANFQYDCFAKHYLMNPNGGGISYIGNTDIGWSSEYMQLQYLLDALYVTTSHPINLRRYDIGSAFQNIIKKAYSTDWRLHLLGDPEMQVWTNVPQTLTAPVSPTSLQVGQHSINVSISNLQPKDTALICVQKGTEVYETLIAGANNVYTIPVEAETPGTMYVTVTAHNYFPVEDSVQITASATANPIIQSINFIDDNSNGSIGNGNGQNDAGETICLQATLKNNGGMPASNLTIELSSTSGYISHLLDSIFTVAVPIYPNDSIVTQFRYQINKDSTERLSNDPNPVQLKLDIKYASATVWTKTFNINVYATDLQQRNKVNINPYPITANQTVTFNVELQNVGQAPTNGLKAVLTCNNAANIVSSCSSTEHSYPSIGKFETKTATTPFQFTTGSGYTANTTLNFNLAVTDAYGKTKNCPFDLNKPDTVLGLQSFAKVREIDLTWKVPASGASGYNIYRCNVDSVTGNESGGYVRLNATPVTLTFYNDADSLKILTKYYYKVHTVSQSGMESDSVRLLAWTSYPTTGLYPIVMGDLTGTRMESNFVAEDVNNDGKKEIFTSVAGGDSGGIGDLVALNWEGSELFHIKDNITIYSGFANLQTSIRAGVAIGDINQDGVNEIVSVTRGFENNNMNNKITCHIAYPKNGDNKPDMLWQTPAQWVSISGSVIDNLDNSPDGSMEIVVIPDGNTDPIYRTPKIYNAQGKLIQELPLAGGNSTYAASAVADLDGKGEKEIIAGYTDGIYVWRRDGKPFGTKNPFFTLPGYNFASSPVVCDINNDGKKEILLSAFLTDKPTSCRILAIDTSGVMLPGWDTTRTENTYTSTANNSWTINLTKEIVVGDLEGNDSLDVVAVGANGINIWNNNGKLSTINLPGLESQGRYPLLADIDGDNEAEIIVTSFSEGKIYGYKRSGAQVLGFPLQTDLIFGNATPVIADLDGDGKSEIAAGTPGDKKIYVWKTNGNPNRIEWGSARHDARNTGEYQKICPPTQILSNTAWNSIMDICNNLIVEPGATLTLNSACKLNMNGASMLIVRPGANLVIDGATILNANIKAMPQSSVTMKNNGYIKLRENGEFNILLGAAFDNQLGSIENTQ